jgi:hypothetical protein
MNRTDQCALAARLAKIVGADHEDPDHPRWHFDDVDRSITGGCVVREQRVSLQLEVTPPVAEKLLTVLAGVRWQDT